MQAIQSVGASVDQLAHLAVLSLPSPSSRRNYSRVIRDYLARGHPLSRDGLQTYIASLRDRSAGRSTVNVALAAVRLLAREAWTRGLLTDSEMTAMERIRGVPAHGEACGRWIGLEDVRVLLQTAGERGNGVRDRAVLACMVGCGMRRAEVVGLTWEQWQQRGDRWVFCDITGKGGRVRTIPVPPWVASYVNAWKEIANGNDTRCLHEKGGKDARLLDLGG